MIHTPENQVEFVALAIKDAFEREDLVRTMSLKTATMLASAALTAGMEWRRAQPTLSKQATASEDL